MLSIALLLTTQLTKPQLISAIRSVYRNCDAYADTGTATTVITDAGKQMAYTTKFKTLYRRPGYIRFEFKSELHKETVLWTTGKQEQRDYVPPYGNQSRKTSLWIASVYFGKDRELVEDKDLDDAFRSFCGLYQPQVPKWLFPTVIHAPDILATPGLRLRRTKTKDILELADGALTATFDAQTHLLEETIETTPTGAIVTTQYTPKLNPHIPPSQFKK